MKNRNREGYVILSLSFSIRWITKTSKELFLSLFGKNQLKTKFNQTKPMKIFAPLNIPEKTIAMFK